MKRLLLLSSLALTGCATWPEVSTLPIERQEEIRARDPRLEAAYERVHPVPGPGLQVKTDAHQVLDQRRRLVVEFWFYLSGSW